MQPAPFLCTHTHAHLQYMHPVPELPRRLHDLEDASCCDDYFWQLLRIVAVDPD